MQRRKSGLTNLEIPLMRIQAVRQATLEVTGSSRVRVHCDVVLSFHRTRTTRVHIDPAVWYIAVGLGYPGRVGAAKGWVVHPLKSHMSWVQYVARQYGSISWECCLLRERVLEYERNGDSAPLVDRL
jgi:hypothetical protein